MGEQLIKLALDWSNLPKIAVSLQFLYLVSRLPMQKGQKNDEIFAFTLPSDIHFFLHKIKAIRAFLL
jgi:hypothetical protein